MKEKFMNLLQMIAHWFYLFLEAFVEHQSHTSVQVFFHAWQIVSFVGINLLFEESSTVSQRFWKNHALHKMDIIVCCSVDL